VFSFKDTFVILWVTFSLFVYLFLFNPTVKSSLPRWPVKPRSNIRPCVRPYGVNIFKTLAPKPLGRGRWNLACVFYECLGTKLLGSGILNLGLCATWGHPELSPVGRHDQSRAGCSFSLLTVALFVNGISCRLTVPDV